MLLFSTVLLCLLCKLAPYVLPLILALLLSLLIEPLVRFLAIRKDARGRIVKPGIPRKLSVIVAMALVFSILLVLIVLLINGITARCCTWPAHCRRRLPQLSQSITELLAQLQQRLNFLSPELLQVAQSTFSRVGEQLMQGVSELATGLITSMTHIPTLLLFFIITVLSTYILASSRESLLHGMHNQLPTPWVKQFRNMYNSLIRALLGWLRAQVLIMCVLFIVMAVGFAILRIHSHCSSPPASHLWTHCRSLVPAWPSFPGRRITFSLEAPRWAWGCAYSSCCHLRAPVRNRYTYRGCRSACLPC